MTWLKSLQEVKRAKARTLRDLSLEQIINMSSSSSSEDPALTSTLFWFVLKSFISSADFFFFFCSHKIYVLTSKTLNN